PGGPRRRRGRRPLGLRRGARGRPRLRHREPRALPGQARSRVRAAHGFPRARLMGLLRLPEPYDFELSTERYRAFGPDLANLWLEGSLHRVVGRREVRISAARGGVRVEPLNAETRPAVRKLLGVEFDLASFYEWADGEPVLARLTRELAGLRPPLAPDPFE